MKILSHNKNKLFTLILVHWDQIEGNTYFWSDHRNYFTLLINIKTTKSYLPEGLTKNGFCLLIHTYSLPYYYMYLSLWVIFTRLQPIYNIYNCVCLSVTCNLYTLKHVLKTTVQRENLSSKTPEKLLFYTVKLTILNLIFFTFCLSFFLVFFFQFM